MTKYFAPAFSLLFATGSVFAQTAIAPPEFESMEIETKWDLTREQYFALVKEFALLGSENAKWKEWTVNDRWSGNLRQFVDVYYDAGEFFTKNRCAFRQRTRSSVDKKHNELTWPGGEKLAKWDFLDGFEWEANWHKMQYKSTPYRYGDVWFRKEIGTDDNIEVEDLEGLLAGKDHSSTTAIKADHGEDFFTKHELKPTRKVVDYRFRATFGDNELFELSIDRFKIADFREGSWVFDDREYFEAELEIVGVRNLNSVKELYDLTRELREEFSLRPPKMSKSGVDVTNHGLVNVRGKDRAWYGSITEALKAADPGATVVVEPSVYAPEEPIRTGDKVVTSRHLYSKNPEDISGTVISSSKLKGARLIDEEDTGLLQLHGFTIQGNQETTGSLMLEGRGARLEHLIFADRGSKNADIEAQNLQGTQSLEVVNCFFQNSSAEQAILIRGCETVTLKSCRFLEGQRKMTLSSVNNLVVE